MWSNGGRFPTKAMCAATRWSFSRAWPPMVRSISSAESKSGTKSNRETLVFLTNHLKFGATTIAAIYKDRWKVELFFKAIKQNLKIKTFLGASANAVHTQI